MCGISGIYARSITDQHIQLVNAVMQSQIARGPDFQASELVKGNQSQALLGHNRLSIIDLSEQANQPMRDATGRYCIVYNGEIYNYIELRSELEGLGLVFKTSSDTEVILNSFLFWGVDSLQRFQGPFAFALFDNQRDELWLCRDRFGIRPLYYTQINNVLYFASSTSTLAKKLNLKPNLSYVAKGLKYLVYEDGSDISAYENMLSLPAGSHLQAKFYHGDSISCEVKTYYDLANNVENLIHRLPTSDTDDLLQEITNKLEKAVQIRLRADVPLGISLSGGLDSSSVAALVSKQHFNTIGFSFGHPDIKKTEGPLVSQCAKFLNIQMKYVWPTHNEMIEALYKTIEIQDAPFSSLSIVAQYMLYKQVRSFGVKVLLGGQGGDEAFMGYKKFLLFQLRQGLNQRRYIRTAKNFLETLPMILSEVTSLKTYWHHRHRYMRSKDTSTPALRLPESPKLCLGLTDQALWKRQMQDITQFSLPTLLRYEDRNAMGHSVESRLPYMDHQLIELGLALPQTLKLRAGYGKWAIREIMQDKIPNQIRLARYKRGFDIPVSALLKAGLGRSIRTTLQSHPQIIKEFMHYPMDVNNVFSDQQLVNRQHAMSEAITLLWLSKALT